MKVNEGQYSGKTNNDADDSDNTGWFNLNFINCLNKIVIAHIGISSIYFFLLLFEGLGKTLNMYDLPGHDRLRYSFLDQHKEEAKAIVYVIDASTIKQKLRYDKFK